MATPEALEQQLRDDVRALDAQLENDRFVEDLYRALTRTRWSRADGEGAVALSFTRAEELLNELRRERGQQPLELAQTGGEGDASGWAADALRERGWQVGPLDPSRHDDAHLDSTPDAPRTEPQDSLAEGHREADEGRPVPRQSPSSR